MQQANPEINIDVTFNLVTSGLNVIDTSVKLVFAANCMKMEDINKKTASGEDCIMDSTSMKAKSDV